MPSPQTSCSPLTTTDTANDFCAVFPESSDAVQVTTVVPTLNLASSVGLHVTATSPSVSSIAVAVKS